MRIVFFRGVARPGRVRLGRDPVFREEPLPECLPDGLACPVEEDGRRIRRAADDLRHLLGLYRVNLKGHDAALPVAEGGEGPVDPLERLSRLDLLIGPAAAADGVEVGLRRLVLAVAVGDGMDEHGRIPAVPAVGVLLSVGDNLPCPRLGRGLGRIVGPAVLYGLEDAVPEEVLELLLGKVPAPCPSVEFDTLADGFEYLGVADGLAVGGRESGVGVCVDVLHGASACVVVCFLPPEAGRANRRAGCLRRRNNEKKGRC